MTARFAERLRPAAGRMRRRVRRSMHALSPRKTAPLHGLAMRRAHRIFYDSQVWARTEWLGDRALKNPLDMWIYQEILHDTRPEVIVETGTYRGGSAFFLATIGDALGIGEIISIDHDPVREDYPVHPRITYLGGRISVDPGVISEVRKLVDGRRTMVVLDSDHSQANVAAELEAYAPIVTPGCYLVVEDTNIGIVAKHDRPGPKEAVESFLHNHREFAIDRDREKFMITHNPGGWLRRTT